jgi:hypothetical protein
MCEQQYQAEVLDELKQQDYNIVIETKGECSERAVNVKCRPGSRKTRSIGSLGKTTLHKQTYQRCESWKSMDYFGF